MWKIEWGRCRWADAVGAAVRCFPTWASVLICFDERLKTVGSLFAIFFHEMFLWRKMFNIFEHFALVFSALVFGIKTATHWVEFQKVSCKFGQEIFRIMFICAGKIYWMNEWEFFFVVIQKTIFPLLVLLCVATQLVQCLISFGCGYINVEHNVNILWRFCRLNM